MANLRHSVIFSFWKTTLDLVSSALHAHSIGHLRVDGDVTPKKRNNILLDFKDNNAWRVLIMTFSTGSIGFVNSPRASLPSLFAVY